MGHQIIRQPDGRLAVFSSGTNSWVISDATPEDLLGYYAERAAEEARRRTQQILDAVLAGVPERAYHQSTMTFEEADRSAEHTLDEERRLAMEREDAEAAGK